MCGVNKTLQIHVFFFLSAVPVLGLRRTPNEASFLRDIFVVQLFSGSWRCTYDAGYLSIPFHLFVRSARGLPVVLSWCSGQEIWFVICWSAAAAALLDGFGSKPHHWWLDPYRRLLRLVSAMSVQDSQQYKRVGQDVEASYSFRSVRKNLRRPNADLEMIMRRRISGLERPSEVTRAPR